MTYSIRHILSIIAGGLFLCALIWGNAPLAYVGGLLLSIANFVP